MNWRNVDWSPRGRARVWLWTVFGTLGCIVVALYVDSFNYMSFDEAARLRAIAVNILLPVCLAGPLLFFFSRKLRELAIAHHQVSLLATTDSLTAVLNRGAFTMLVDAWLQQARSQEEDLRGALLVIDADNFKAINDTYGHQNGDEALKIIAGSIKGILRSADLVGRIGGEEFGVFLPGSNPAQAQAVAERIRASISVAEFAPAGAERRPLSVSVGGATFERKVEFAELFRLTDRQLYDAKERGKNRVLMAPMGDHAAAAA